VLQLTQELRATQFENNVTCNSSVHLMFEYQHQHTEDPTCRFALSVMMLECNGYGVRE
jgi:hypothetical protein